MCVLAERMIDLPYLAAHATCARLPVDASNASNAPACGVPRRRRHTDSHLLPRALLRIGLRKRRRPPRVSPGGLRCASALDRLASGRGIVPQSIFATIIVAPCAVHLTERERLAESAPTGLRREWRLDARRVGIDDDLRLASKTMMGCD